MNREPDVRPRVYLETSVVSYLAARPSRDLVTAGHQQSTRDWWEERRADFAVVASQLVLREVGKGDPAAAQHRFGVLKEVQLLDITQDARLLAGALSANGIIPESSTDDALHVAIAAVNGCRYLLTWNYRHLVGAGKRSRIEAFCRDEGYEPAIICTPEELMEDEI